MSFTTATCVASPFSRSRIFRLDKNSQAVRHGALAVGAAVLVCFAPGCGQGEEVPATASQPNAASFKPRPTPPAPTDELATALSGSSIQVTWTDNSGNEKGFEVSNGAMSIELGDNATRYTWSGLSPGTYMCFRIRAFNAAGYSAWTPYACTTTWAPPAAPTGETATALSSSSIRVSWTDNSDDEIGFEVSNGTVSYWLDANTTSYTWSGLSLGTHLCFRIRAYNSEGFSAWTPDACTATWAPPATPMNQTATATSGTTILVSWTDSSDNETAFEVSNGVTTIEVGANVTRYTWSELSPDTYMCFRIRAYNSEGYSGWTSDVCATTPDAILPVPAAPTGELATALSSSSIRVSWTDNSINEEGFEVNDGTTSIGVSVNVTHYTWSGLSPGAQACFRIRAYNSWGPSAWTPDACATTSPPPAPPDEAATR